MGNFEYIMDAFVITLGLAFTAFIGVMSARDEHEQERTH